MELDDGAAMQVLIKPDGASAWTAVRAVAAAGKRSYNLPIIPRRADHYRIKLTGSGGCKIYSLAREFYSGSEM
jgi:hypothetical protein